MAPGKRNSHLPTHVRAARPMPCLEAPTRARPAFERRPCKSRCITSRRKRLRRAIIPHDTVCVHTFGASPSEGSPSLRTHVPPLDRLNACATHARCRPPHTLVPAARGRLRRRLGGRPERACRGTSSASGGAAQALEGWTPGSPTGAPARVPVPGQPRRLGEQQTGRPRAARGLLKKPAASYSPRPLRAKYHRR